MISRNSPYNIDIMLNIRHTSLKPYHSYKYVARIGAITYAVLLRNTVKELQRSITVDKDI